MIFFSPETDLTLKPAIDLICDPRARESLESVLSPLNNGTFTSIIPIKSFEIVLFVWRPPRKASPSALSLISTPANIGQLLTVPRLLQETSP